MLEEPVVPECFLNAILHTPPIWRPFCGTQEFCLETNQFMEPSNETRKHFLPQRSASQVRSTSFPKEALLWTIITPIINSKKVSSQEAFLGQVSAHKLTPRSNFCPIGSKALFSDPCLITWWPTSVLNRPASSKRGAMQHPLWESFSPYRFDSTFVGPPALLLGGRHRF